MDQLTKFWRKLSCNMVRCPQATLSIAGNSYQNRSIPLVKISSNSGLSPAKKNSKNNNLNILITAGQHGDELLTVDLALELLTQAGTPEFSRLLNSCTLYLLPLTNPDGFAVNQRNNAMDIDLNRDHQLLRAPETRVIHQVFRESKADVIIDLHTYPARRKDWLELGYFKPYDVMLDTATHPNASPALQKFALEKVLPAVGGELKQHNFLYSRYFIGGPPPKRVRHSTPDVHDLRNASGLYQSLSLLLELRHAYKLYGKRFKRSLQAGSLALCKTLEIIAQNALYLRTAIDQERQAIASGARKVFLWSRYRHTSKNIELKSTEDNQIVTVPVKRFSNRIEATESIQLPKGYMIPAGNKLLLELLKNHGVALKNSQQPKNGALRCYEIMELTPSGRKNRAPRRMNWLLKKYNALPADNYISIKTTEWNAMLLAVLLEPRSKYGLSRFNEFDLGLTAGSCYPILRLSSD